MLGICLIKEEICRLNAYLSQGPRHFTEELQPENLITFSWASSVFFSCVNHIIVCCFPALLCPLTPKFFWRD